MDKRLAGQVQAEQIRVCRKVAGGLTHTELVDLVTHMMTLLAGIPTPQETIEKNKAMTKKITELIEAEMRTGFYGTN
jgi:hypothetical protein